MKQNNIDWGKLERDIKRGETKAINKFAAVVWGAMKRNIKARKTTPKSSPYPTQRPESHWKKSFKYEKATAEHLEALVGATTDKNSRAQSTLEHGGNVTWTYASILASIMSKTERKRFFSEHNLQHKSTKETMLFLKKKHTSYTKHPFVAKTLAEMQNKYLPSFRNIL